VRATETADWYRQAGQRSPIEAVRNDDSRDQSFGVMKDGGYLIYLLDEDRDGSLTGMADFLLFDKSGPWRDLIGKRV
jgi:hypothetical protein